MVAAFVVLLAFHLWLLYRMIVAQNTALAVLLVIAIGLFAWRIHHYVRLYTRVAGEKGARTREEELRQTRIMIPVLAALLALHAWLISLMYPPPSIVETVFLALLVLAVAVFVARLVYYARRYRQLTR